MTGEHEYTKVWMNKWFTGTIPFLGTIPLFIFSFLQPELIQGGAARGATESDNKLAAEQPLRL